MITASSFLQRYSFQTAGHHVLRRPTESMAMHPLCACMQHSIDDDTSKSNSKEWNLMMISCEENPPYGPSKDAAVMFLELLCQAFEKYCNIMRRQQMDDSSLTICITVYHAQSITDYPLTPLEWSSYDGVIIPGSLSAAYDNTNLAWDWKAAICDTEGYTPNETQDTLGVCFGHQCFAHAFGGTTAACDNQGGGGMNDAGGRENK